MSRSYSVLQRPDRYRPKWLRSPHAMPAAAVVIVTEAMARAEDVARRARRKKRGNYADLYMAELARLQRLIGQPVDELFS